MHKYTYRPVDTTEQVFLYSITHYDMSLDKVHSDSVDITVQEIFDETLTSISDRIRGEVLYTQEEKFYDFPARISRIRFNDDRYSLKSKMIFANDKIYWIEVFSTYDKGGEFKIRKFINSFTLTES